MIRNNDVCAVLVTQGNQPLAPTGTKLVALAPNQLGYFDANTGLAVDPTGSVIPRQSYFAVGIDSTGIGTTNELVKSAGSHIQSKNIRYASYKPYVAPAPMIIKLGDFTSQFDTEYGLKLEFRNQEIYRTIGYNQYTKTYVVKTECAKNCESGCDEADSNQITRDLIINITNDTDNLIIGEAIARDAIVAATVGTSVNYAIGEVISTEDLDAIIAFNATQDDTADYLATDLQITTKPLQVADFCSVNLKYYNPRQTIVIPSKIGAFTCNGTVETTQEAVFEEGAGIDVKQLEYYAKGFKESPYRVSELIGVADNKVFTAQAATKYDCFTLAYEQQSNGGWLEYIHSESTTFAIPTADVVTVTALKTLIAAIAESSDEPIEGDLT